MLRGSCDDLGSGALRYLPGHLTMVVLDVVTKRCAWMGSSSSLSIFYLQHWGQLHTSWLALRTVGGVGSESVLSWNKLTW